MRAPIDESPAAERVRAASPEGGVSDEDVVRRVLAGDLGAFELLMRRNNQRLFRVIRGVLRDDAEAEDALQETYLLAFRGLAGFEGRAKLATWLTRIAVHEALGRRRRERRAAVNGVALEAASMIAPNGHESEDGEAAASRREVRGIVTAAADGLPASLRVVLVLRDVEGLDTGETAECLGISEANVKVRLHRARALLRARMERELGAEVGRLYAFDGDRCDRIVRAVLGRITADPNGGRG